MRCLAMDSTTLFIQGPPGTGKTFTSAHVICSLIAAGKRAGVSSNSHKAINNLLAKVEEVADETGLSFVGVKKCTRGNDDQRLNGRIITDVESAGDVLDRHRLCVLQGQIDARSIARDNHFPGG